MTKLSDTHAEFKKSLAFKKACICKGDGSYGWDYIGENTNDEEVTWNKPNNATKSPEPTKQLKNSIGHCFT